MNAKLIQALDDGQEIEYFKWTGRTVGYLVRVHGDCYFESKPSATIEEAETEVAAKYESWKNAEPPTEED
jgi:hypothetical protein